MTTTTFPLSNANMTQCMAERDAEIERLRGLIIEVQKSEVRHVDETRRLRARLSLAERSTLLARKAALQECAQRLEAEADEISDDDYTTDKETLRWAAQTIRALKDKP